jgi:uncharacterized protein (UPF0335 family)
MTQLIDIFNSIEELEAQIKDLMTFKREAYAQAKNQGFDTKIIRKVIRIRKNRKEYQQEIDNVALYLNQIKE